MLTKERVLLSRLALLGTIINKVRKVKLGDSGLESIFLVPNFKESVNCQYFWLLIVSLFNQSSSCPKISFIKNAFVTFSSSQSKD